MKRERDSQTEREEGKGEELEEVFGHGKFGKKYLLYMLLLQVLFEVCMYK